MADAAAFAGAFAGFVETLVVQPLDLVKTRFQLNVGRNPGVLGGLRELVAEGGARRLYRGLLPELAGNVPTRMGMWAGKDFAARGLSRAGCPRSAWTELGAGLFAGLPEAVATTPFQVVKVRMMSKENNGLYRNSADCFARVLRAEGALALFRGLSATVARNGVWNGAYFVSMFHIHRLLLASCGAQRGPLLKLQQLGSGFCGGVLATCCNAPLDVAKSRIQAAAGPARTRQSAGVILLRVLREEGPRALYKGFAPKAWRMGLGGAVGVVAYELAMDFLR